MHLLEFIALYEASSFQKDQFFLAASFTSMSPMSKVDRSSVMFFSQVECGRPGDLLQISGVDSKRVFGSRLPY